MLNKRSRECDNGMWRTITEFSLQLMVTGYKCELLKMPSDLVGKCITTVINSGSVEGRAKRGADVGERQLWP